tara:strand:+ start:741 stop:899 length:159 start_codon:yes stop_codon:yes gene_type:complete
VNLENLKMMLIMGEHGVYVWTVFFVLFTLLGLTFMHLNQKIKKAKKQINEEK